jgi:DNA topoisomerase VI subunit B
LADFCSEKELTTQTGHAKSEWPLVVLKELTDNALDACEEAGIAPEVTVRVNDQGISVQDNGPGLAPATVRKILDYTHRTSSREAYVSPCRGAQGNALQVILAMPFVLDGNTGQLALTAQGIRHDVRFRIDQIRQTPVLDCQTQTVPRSPGTQIRVGWPVDPTAPENDENDDEDSASKILLDAKERSLQMGRAFSFLNPHLTLRIHWLDEPPLVLQRTAKEWCKWRPSDPTSPHWYQPEHLARLIGAYVSHDVDNSQARTVRAFVSEFRGLSATAKQKSILAATGLERSALAALADVGKGEMDMKAITALLHAMQQHSKPVRPVDLGVIGEAHLRHRMEEAGGQMEAFAYKAIKNVGPDGLPYVVESAFAPRRSAFAALPHNELVAEPRLLIAGVNWSAAVNHPFRSLGSFGASLEGLLFQQRCGGAEPIIFLLHVAKPRVGYVDRGKSGVIL